MDTINRIFNEKKISESSKKLYLRNLIKLNDGVPPKNFKYIENPEHVMEKIKNYKPNTQRSFIISIVSLFKHLSQTKKKYETLYNKYYDILDKMNKDLKDQTTKTEKEQSEWVSNDYINNKLSSLLSILTELKDVKRNKITQTQYENLLKLVVAGLFIIQPPRRNKDYQVMQITKGDNMEDKDMNYLNLNTNQFVYNNYKTKGKYQTQINELEPVMREIVDTYLKYHPYKTKLTKKNNIPFLVDFDGKTLETVNAITRLLYKVFDNKKVGSSMLRKIYLTTKYGDVMDSLKEDATDMGTSTITIQNNYIKKKDKKD